MSLHSRDSPSSSRSGRTVEHFDATVFVVDDDETARYMLVVLAESSGLKVEVYASAEEFLEQYDGKKVGCLVLDVCLPGMDGLELQQRLNLLGFGLPVIFVTAHGEISLASQVIRAGAIDLIQKPFNPQTLLARIHEAIGLDRENVKKRELAKEIAERMSNLTRRELEIMHLLAKGDSVQQIATQLSITRKTVDNHRSKILDKMKVDNPTQLLRFLDSRLRAT